MRLLLANVFSVSWTIKLLHRLTAVTLGKPFSSTASMLQCDKSMRRNAVACTNSPFWLSVSRWLRLKLSSASRGMWAKVVLRSVSNLHWLKSRTSNRSAIRSGTVRTGLSLRFNCSKFTRPLSMSGPPIFVIMQLLRSSRFKLLLVRNRRSSLVLKLFSGFPARLSVCRLTAECRNVFGLMWSQLEMLLFDRSSRRSATGSRTTGPMLSISLFETSSTSSAVNWPSWLGSEVKRLNEKSKCLTKCCNRSEIETSNHESEDGRNFNEFTDDYLDAFQIGIMGELFVRASHNERRRNAFTCLRYLPRTASIRIHQFRR